MLDIILVWLLFGRSVGSLASRKGQKPTLWKLYLVLAWFGLEVVGLFIGMVISKNLILAALLGLASGFGGFLMIRYRLEQFPDIPEENWMDRLGKQQDL